MTIRKIHRSFKGVCLNPKSKLSDEQCKKLAVGAMYASQQGAYQNSIETGISDLLPKILGEWWGIESTDAAKEELDYLCEKGTGITSLLCIRHFCLASRKPRMKSFSRT